MLKSRIRYLERVIDDLEEIFDLSLDMIGSGNLDGYFTKINTSFTRILGYSENEFLRHPFLYFVHDADRQKTAEALHAAAKGESDLYVENRYRCKDGSFKWIEWKVRSVASENRFIAVGREISDRKLAEEALRKSEERFKIAGKAAYDLIYEWDVTTDTLEWFGDIDGLLGFEQGEISRNLDAWLSLIHEEDRPLLADAAERHRSSTEPIQYQYRIGRKDGSYCYWNDHALPILDDNGLPHKWVGVCTDITARIEAELERKKLEEMLHREEKMNSLGVMAGGIAHDLNNILAGVVSYPDLLLMNMDDNDPLKKPIEHIKDSGQRAADVVSDLLTISKGATIKKELINLSSFVEEYKNSSEAFNILKMHPLVDIETRLDETVFNSWLSPVHMTKALTNLILNAAEAIVEKGRIEIKTENCYLDSSFDGYENMGRGEYVKLTVADDGVGISPDDLKYIFEPFYTKKVMGRSGTGLGLAVVWNMVHDHDGYIHVRSDERGTVFELYFRATREKISPEEQVPIETYTGNGESILVIDDEESQREIASAMLSSLGYHVRCAESGEKAIDYLRDNKVDLVVLDMIMDPGIDGLQTYKKILEIHPKQKAIIVSGFSETDKVKEAQRLGAGAYVKKPYLLETLGPAVNRELHSFPKE